MFTGTRSVVDRRRFQRLSLNLSVWYKVESPLYIRNIIGPQEYEAKTIDVGRGGMAFLAAHNIPTWTMLRLKIVLFKTDRGGLVSFSDPIEIAAEVRSTVFIPESREYRIGVCFHEVTVHNSCEIANFLRTTLTLQV